MKLIITLCVVAAAITFATTADASGKEILDFLIENVESAFSNLESYNTNIMDELTSLLTEDMTFRLTEIQALRKDTWDYATEKVEAAKLEGKEVDHCLPDLEEKLTSADEVVTTALKKCVDTNLRALSKIQKLVELHLAKKKSIMKQFDEIMTKCESEIPATVETCIAKEVPRLTLIAQRYYISAMAMRFSEETFVFTAPFSTSICFMKPITDYTMFMESGKLSVNDCITAA